MTGQSQRFGARDWVLACLLAAGLLAACSRGSGGSSSPQSAANPAPVDPCSALDVSQIQSALGVAPTGPGKRENLGVTDECTWDLSNGAAVSVTLYNPTGAAAFYTPSVSSRRPDDKSYEAVSGLGDQAVYRDDSRPPVINASQIVEVVKGKRHFDVQYVVISVSHAQAASKDALTSLARTVLVHAH